MDEEYSERKILCKQKVKIESERLGTELYPPRLCVPKQDEAALEHGKRAKSVSPLQNQAFYPIHVSHRFYPVSRAVSS